MNPLTFREIKPGQEKEIESLSFFASSIIREYYDPIIGERQNSYHLRKFQSVEGIKSQLEHGYTYYECFLDDTPIGFFAYYPRKDALYLSKYYLHKDYRGQGHGKAIMDFLKESARKEGLRAIELNVNRFNPTTKIYDRFGFYIVKEEKVDIGEGFVMDDYVYRLDLD
ncbi:MAG: GNAT family N-acetyltransferase [Bacilli bacterium]|nr:GNAT family N-acetyltransferase [Bacilli bacterium]